MKHCPIGGSEHKEYYVRVSPNAVQCLYQGCNRVFVSIATGKEKEKWNVEATFRPFTDLPPVSEFSHSQPIPGTPCRTGTITNDLLRD